MMPIKHGVLLPGAPLIFVSLFMPITFLAIYANHTEALRLNAILHVAFYETLLFLFLRLIDYLYMTISLMFYACSKHMEFNYHFG